MPLGRIEEARRFGRKLGLWVPVVAAASGLFVASLVLTLNVRKASANMVSR